MSSYIIRVLVAIDILLMAILGGKRNETLSACAWSLEQDGKLLGLIFRPLIDLVFFLEPYHCFITYSKENSK